MRGVPTFFEAKDVVSIAVPINGQTEWQLALACHLCLLHLAEFSTPGCVGTNAKNKLAGWRVLVEMRFQFANGFTVRKDLVHCNNSRVSRQLATFVGIAAFNHCVDVAPVPGNGEELEAKRELQ